MTCNYNGLLETISLTMPKLIKNKINQMVEDNPIKSPREFYMDPSPDENIKKALSKFLTMLVCLKPQMM